MRGHRVGATCLALCMDDEGLMDWRGREKKKRTFLRNTYLIWELMCMDSDFI